jgi:hypothetical protein
VRDSRTSRSIVSSTRSGGLRQPGFGVHSSE